MPYRERIAFEDFNLASLNPSGSTARGSASSHADRRITVSSVSLRATASQVQAFFSKFGAVQLCRLAAGGAAEHDRDAIRVRPVSMYATISKAASKRNSANNAFHITFKSADGAAKAKRAEADQLVFYGQQMRVGAYTGRESGSSRRRTTSQQQLDSGNELPVVVITEGDYYAIQPSIYALSI